MGICEHLSADLLSDYLRGAAAPGRALAVEAHLELCEQCRREAGRAVPRGSMSGDQGPAEEPQIEAGEADNPAPGRGLPAVLTRTAKGPWRRVAPGVRRSRLRGVSGLGESAQLLSVDPGALLGLPPAASVVVVLRGGVRSAVSVHPPGDFIETAGIRLQDASADSAAGCLCLVVGDDDLYRRPVLDQLRAWATKPRR